MGFPHRLTVMDLPLMSIPLGLPRVHWMLLSACCMLMMAPPIMFAWIITTLQVSCSILICYKYSLFNKLFFKFWYSVSFKIIPVLFDVVNHSLHLQIDCALESALYFFVECELILILDSFRAW